MKIIEKGKRFVHMDSQIQLTGNREVLVDGCRKILEYNDVFVKVKTWEMMDFFIFIGRVLLLDVRINSIIMIRFFGVHVNRYNYKEL